MTGLESTNAQLPSHRAFVLDLVTYRMFRNSSSKMWSDNETSKDLIGFRVHADLVREVVTDQKLLPVTLGVFADWGNGKTSIMRMLSEDLSKDPEIAVIYFDAWLFEGYDDAKSALLTAILTQLSEHERFPPSLKGKANALIKKVNWMRVLKMGWDKVALPAVLAYATGGATAIPSVMGLVGSLFKGKDESGGSDTKESILNSESLNTDSLNEEDMDVRSFRKEFGQLLADSKFKSLVVMIDDLDRCSPERIVENLEAIKLFLNVKGSAFVIGADLRIVSHAISVRYGKAIEAAAEAAAAGLDSSPQQLVRDYVEKLIQIPYHLPRLSPAEVETYMTLLFCETYLSDADFAKCIEACDKQRRRNRFSAFGLAAVNTAVGAEKIGEELQTALNFVAGGATLITENLKGNPRQVKRFLNAFILRRKLAKVAQLETCKEEVLLKLMLLEYSEPQRFKELSRWQEEESGRPEAIKALENDSGPPPEGWGLPKLKSWAIMLPHLSTIDLSDYFWLARDKLGASISGVSLIAPSVRAAFEALMSPVGRKRVEQLITELQSDELECLKDQLAGQLRRDPSNSEGYTAFLECVKHAPSLCVAMLDTFELLPAKHWPGWLSTRLTLLERAHPAIAESISKFTAKLKSAEGTSAAIAANHKPKPR